MPTVFFLHNTCLFVCFEVLRPSQPNRVMSSAVSLPNHTFTGQAQSSKRLTSIVHILSPEIHVYKIIYMGFTILSAKIRICSF